MARPKVLLVEDNQRIGSQLRALLESMQWDVYTATTGIEALLTYNRELPQLIIMEQFLPLLSGEELICRLRRQVSPAQLPIVIMTSSRFGVLSNDMRSMVNAICQKPLHAQQFRDAVQQTYQTTMGTARPRPVPGIHEPEQFYLAWGDLLQTPLPALLFQLKEQHQTGVLTLTLPQGDRRIAFQDGELVYAESLIPEEQFTHFLLKKVKQPIGKAQLDKVVAGTGARAALQREAIHRAQLLPEQELNLVYQLYLENIIIRSMFLTQGPYQFIDDVAYVKRTAAMPINVLLLLFEGVRRYYTPQKLLQALSPYHLYRCNITPLYTQQISSLIPRFQGISFSPQRLAGKTVQQLLREFTSNPQTSGQLLQTLSLARLLVFSAPDGTAGHVQVHESKEGPVLFEGALPPLGGQFERGAPASSRTPKPQGYSQAYLTPHPRGMGTPTPHPVMHQSSHTPHPVMHQSSHTPHPTLRQTPPTPGSPYYTEPIPGLSQTGLYGPTLKENPVQTEMVPSVVMQQMMRERSPLPANVRQPTGHHHAVHESRIGAAVPGTPAHGRSSQTPVVMDREAHLGALAGEDPSSSEIPQPFNPMVRNAPAYNPYGRSDSRSSAAIPASGYYNTTPMAPPSPVVPFAPFANNQAQVPISTQAPYSPVSPTHPMSPPSSPSQTYSPVVPFSPVAPLTPPSSNGHSGSSQNMYQIHPSDSPSALSGVQDSSSSSQPERSWTAQLALDFLQVQSENFFLVMGLKENATNEDIQLAYRRLSQTYSPEQVQRHQDPEIRTKAGEILRRVSQAYNVLTSPQARQQLEYKLQHEKSQMGNRLIFAQEQSKQGEALRKQNRFKEAAVLYKRAIEANPKEPVNYLQLGWSIYRQGSPDPLQRLLSRAYIERALQMNPIFEDAYLYLGIIRKDEGYLDEAASLFQRILLLNPGHAEAYRLLSEVSRHK
ncbi:MAG: DUF4388 domain-containing protein [Deltaproteobacteria bacterium]|nr:MAG: DUF4388 domain-containing protein [Deltaproteobacteria bacterium]